MIKTDTIIWDWNGTLLNDTDICIETINELLSKRGLPLIDKAKYHETFGFPVIDYYRRIGFDFSKEPFEIPALEYIALYETKVRNCSLHSEVPEILSYFESKKYRQVILSASENQMLETMVDHFGIRTYFEQLSGLDNHFATSKTAIGNSLLKALSIKPQQACLIGDTTHDYEVAQQLGTRCILVSNGHQPLKTLKKTGCRVIEQLNELVTCL